MSSKTARLHRRQAANRRKYARLRKAGRVPQHTTAERRHAAAERERQREAEQRRHDWLRRATGPVVTTLGAAAAGVVIVAAPEATGETGHLGYMVQSYSLAQLYPWVPPGSDHPDYPHVPEPDMTFYPLRTTAGTANASVRYGLGAPRWDAWEWARGLMHDD